MRIDVLRETLTRLLMDTKFVLKLAREGVESVPYALYRLERHVVETQERRFRENLRKAARDLLSGEVMTRRVHNLLGKLNEKWRIEAVEMIILANDTSEQFARALVAATPARGLKNLSRKNIYGADPRRIKAMITERDFMYRSTKPAFAAVGRDALDLIAVESFARRLMAMPSVILWLERHDREALHVLSSVR